jgi:RNA polymerase sigma-70 factor (ECF subfamily)
MRVNGHVGKPAWFRDAFSQHEGRLVRYAQRIVGDVERAPDVVQETFLRLAKQQPSDVDGHLTEWLFTVCRNQALDVRRKEQRMTTLAEAAAITTPSRAPEPATAAETQDAAGHILALITALPEYQQEVIHLKFQNSLSYREIAAITGLSVSNVGFLIHRGLKTIRSRVKRAEA